MSDISLFLCVVKYGVLKYVGACSLLMCLAAMPGLAQEPPKPETLPIGSPAPDFELPGVDGKTYSLKDFESYSQLMVIFSCNHCPTAQAYEQRIMDLVEDYRPKGVGFVVISPNDPEAVSLGELGYTDLGDSFEDMKIRAEQLDFNFPYLYDGETQQTSLAYGPVATPHVFLFDQARKLRYVGRLDRSEKPGTAQAEDARAALDALLAGDEVAQSETKTFGCSIKWSWKGDWKAKQEAEWANLPVSLEDMDLAGLKELVANKDGEKLRLINLWATWCGPCIMEFPEFIEIDRMYRHRNFEFVSLSTDQARARPQALKLLKKWEASNDNYLLTIEDKYEMIEAIDPEWNGALPYTLLVAPGGEVVWRQEGTIDPLALKRAIVDHELMGRVY